MITEVIKAINQSLDTDFRTNDATEVFRSRLSAYINELINHDLNKLISLLYRIDVSEKKLSQMLKDQKGENASMLIADMIIDRQLKKIESKNRMKKQGEQEGGEEKW